jgi:hypothetical protein
MTLKLEDLFCNIIMVSEASLNLEGSTNRT